MKLSLEQVNPADSDFATAYQSAPCNFQFGIHGGARPIGHTTEYPVWLSVSDDGLWCVDRTGGSIGFQTPKQAKPYYDPFMYFSA